MNKVVASIIVGLALGAVSAVSAVDMSFGGGGFFAGDWGAGFYGFEETSSGIKGTETSSWSGGGIHAFFDVTYAEISVGLTFAGGTEEDAIAGVVIPSVVPTDVSGTFLNLGVLGKYPIPLNDKMTLFPAVGIDYALCLSGAATKLGIENKFDGLSLSGNPNPTEPKAGDLSALWIKFGAGMDYNLTDKIYIRPEFLYGIRLSNSYEGMMEDLHKAAQIGSSTPSTMESVLGHGLTIKAGVGFRL